MIGQKESTLKQQLREMVDRLPESCTTEDVHYEVYLLDKIRRGEAALKRGGISHREVRRRVAQWAKR